MRVGRSRLLSWRQLKEWTPNRAQSLSVLLENERQRFFPLCDSKRICIVELCGVVPATRAKFELQETSSGGSSSRTRNDSNMSSTARHGREHRCERGTLTFPHHIAFLEKATSCIK